MSTAVALYTGPRPELRPAGTNRYRFTTLARPWRVVDDSGIRTAGNALALPDTENLTFDLAIDFAHRFREEADLAYARRDRASARQWEEWAGELERWAAAHRPAPGRVVPFPTFGDMTRRPAS